MDKATLYHGRLPGLKRLPLPAIGIIGALIVVNIVVWAVVGIVLVGLIHYVPTRHRTVEL
jgi:nickel/cobalt transporter (NiCoT) family protein